MKWIYECSARNGEKKESRSTLTNIKRIKTLYTYNLLNANSKVNMYKSINIHMLVLAVATADADVGFCDKVSYTFRYGLYLVVRAVSTLMIMS